MTTLVIPKLRYARPDRERVAHAFYTDLIYEWQSALCGRDYRMPYLWWLGGDLATDSICRRCQRRIEEEGWND